MAPKIQFYIEIHVTKVEKIILLNSTCPMQTAQLHNCTYWVLIRIWESRDCGGDGALRLSEVYILVLLVLVLFFILYLGIIVFL